MKSNKSINRRTHKNRLSLSRKTKRNNAKNVLKRSTKSQKVYRGGAAVRMRMPKPSTPQECFGNHIVYEYTREEAEQHLNNTTPGTWMFRILMINGNGIKYILSIKNNYGILPLVTHNYIYCTNNKIRYADGNDGGELNTVEDFILNNLSPQLEFKPVAQVQIDGGPIYDVAPHATGLPPLIPPRPPRQSLFRSQPPLPPRA